MRSGSWLINSARRSRTIGWSSTTRILVFGCSAGGGGGDGCWAVFAFLAILVLRGCSAAFDDGAGNQARDDGPAALPLRHRQAPADQPGAIPHRVQPYP